MDVSQEKFYIKMNSTLAPEKYLNFFKLNYIFNILIKLNRYKLREKENKQYKNLEN